MYREFNNNIIFQFEHCLNLLKTLPKWKTMVQLKSKGRSSGTCYSSPQDVIHLGEDNEGENAVVDLEKPLWQEGPEREREREREREIEREQRLWRERDRDESFEWIDRSEEEMA
jgi:hypothetical protein